MKQILLILLLLLPAPAYADALDLFFDHPAPGSFDAARRQLGITEPQPSFLNGTGVQGVATSCGAYERSKQDEFSPPDQVEYWRELCEMEKEIAPIEKELGIGLGLD